jgi:RNA recognition motif-containing protein
MRRWTATADFARLIDNIARPGQAFRTRNQLPILAEDPRSIVLKNIYVGNISFRTTEQDLSDAFGAYGQVDRVQIVKDRDTGQSRGFAFVEMSNEAEADKAIASLNGADVGGRTLTVNEARPREPRAMGGGGGYGNRAGGGGRGGNRRESRW